MTYMELFKLLSKQWANVNDIKKIGLCGRDKASLVRDTIISKIKNEGFNLPLSKEKIVPMTYVVEYYNLDIDYIAKMAQNEKLIEI